MLLQFFHSLSTIEASWSWPKARLLISRILEISRGRSLRTIYVIHEHPYDRPQSDLVLQVCLPWLSTGGLGAAFLHPRCSIIWPPFISTSAKVIAQEVAPAIENYNHTFFPPRLPFSAKNLHSFALDLGKIGVCSDILET